VKKAFKVSS